MNHKEIKSRFRQSASQESGGLWDRIEGELSKDSKETIHPFAGYIEEREPVTAKKNGMLYRIGAAAAVVVLLIAVYPLVKPSVVKDTAVTAPALGEGADMMEEAAEAFTVKEAELEAPQDAQSYQGVLNLDGNRYQLGEEIEDIDESRLEVADVNRILESEDPTGQMSGEINFDVEASVIYRYEDELILFHGESYYRLIPME